MLQALCQPPACGGAAPLAARLLPHLARHLRSILQRDVRVLSSSTVCRQPVVLAPPAAGQQQACQQAASLALRQPGDHGGRRGRSMLQGLEQWQQQQQQQRPPDAAAAWLNCQTLSMHQQQQQQQCLTEARLAPLLGRAAWVGGPLQRHHTATRGSSSSTGGILHLLQAGQLHPRGGWPWGLTTTGMSSSSSSGTAALFTPGSATPTTRRHFSTSSAAASGPDAPPTSSGSSGGATAPPKNLRGKLPRGGPPRRALRALPFAVSRAAAEEAFQAYHARAWYQSRQLPVLAKPFRETFLPFWVGSGTIQVDVRGAEVGHEHLVTR